MSTQVLNLLEIVTNNESTRVRDIHVGPQKVHLRRARTTVTKENVTALQFLDLLSNITPNTLDETERFMLSKYTKDSGITRDEISRYFSLSPSKAMKNVITSGIIYELA